MKPKALDLFCGAGGATKGLQRAGFHVTGVDIRPQSRYCGDVFIQADALTVPLEGYDLIWASPPCQRYTRAQNAARNREAHPDLVGPMRERLMASGIPWAMENVVGAPLLNPVVLCGLAFGLKVKRHRLIESSHLLLVPPCPSHDRDYFVIFGHECRNRRHGVCCWAQKQDCCRPGGDGNRLDEPRRVVGSDPASLQRVYRAAIPGDVPQRVGSGRGDLSLAFHRRYPRGNRLPAPKMLVIDVADGSHDPALVSMRPRTSCRAA